MSELVINTEDHFLQNMGDRISQVIKASLDRDCLEPIHISRAFFSYGPRDVGKDMIIFTASCEAKIMSLSLQGKPLEGSRRITVLFRLNHDGGLTLSFDHEYYDVLDENGKQFARLTPRFGG